MSNMSTCRSRRGRRRLAWPDRSAAAKITVPTFAGAPSPLDLLLTHTAMPDSGPTLETRLFALVGTLVVAAGLTGGLPVVSARPSAPDTLVHVLLETELGEIEVALDSAAAPITATNFLRYVEAGLYAGGTFYRTVRADNQPDDSIRIAVIQGGVDRSRRGEGFDPIPMEGTGTTGLRHLDGTISMARGGPDSARGEFFICVGDQPELDEGGRRNPDGRGFAAFGQVVRGMEVVHAIHGRAAEGQYLTEPVRIVGARRGG